MRISLLAHRTSLILSAGSLLLSVNPIHANPIQAKPVHANQSTGRVAAVPPRAQKAPLRKQLSAARPSAMRERQIAAPVPETSANKAIRLFEEGNYAEAIRLQADEVKLAPADPIAHATMSYFLWRRGSVIDAVKEAQEAAKLAPQNPQILRNLAHMELSVGDYRRAIEVYDQAKAVSPNDPALWLGLARCYFMSNRTEDALTVLQAMANDPTKNFNWHFGVGDTYLKVGNPKLAADATTKALANATTSDEAASGAQQLLLALLRDKQFGKASFLLPEVFRKYPPKDHELYVRIGAALLPASDPEHALPFLKAAFENLRAPQDSDGFYRLGLVFQEKAASCTEDAMRAGQWTDMAGIAFEQAISLAPKQVRYHLALADVLDRQGLTTKLVSTLETAHALDATDPLAPYLASHCSALSGEKQNQQNADTAKQETGAEKQPTNSNDIKSHINLTKLDFNILGLTCGCKLSKIATALKSTPGVAFVNVPSQQPYHGTVLLDTSITEPSTMFSKCIETALAPDPTLKPPPGPASFETVHSEPVTTASAALTLAQKSRGGDILLFYRQFKPMAPDLPVKVAEKQRKKDS